MFPFIKYQIFVCFSKGGFYSETDEPNHFPELEFWNFFMLNGSNLVKMGLEAALTPFWAFRAVSYPYITWFEPFKMKKKKSKF